MSRIRNTDYPLLPGEGDCPTDDLLCSAPESSVPPAPPRHLPTIQCCGSGSVIRCLFDSWIRAPGWVKSQDPDPGYISESLETIFFRLKYLNSLMRIRDKHPGSATLPQSFTYTGSPLEGSLRGGVTRRIFVEKSASFYN